MMIGPFRGGYLTGKIYCGARTRMTDLHQIIIQSVNYSVQGGGVLVLQPLTHFQSVGTNTTAGLFHRQD